MEITIDLDTLRIFCHFEKRRHPKGRDRCYAIVTDRSDGWTMQMAIPELCRELNRIASGEPLFPGRGAKNGRFSVRSV